MAFDAEGKPKCQVAGNSPQELAKQAEVAGCVRIDGTGPDGKPFQMQPGQPLKGQQMMPLGRDWIMVGMMQALNAYSQGQKPVLAMKALGALAEMQLRCGSPWPQPRAEKPNILVPKKGGIILPGGAR
jgi:hypothetical protein